MPRTPWHFPTKTNFSPWVRSKHKPENDRRSSIMNRIRWNSGGVLKVVQPSDETDQASRTTRRVFGRVRYFRGWRQWLNQTSGRNWKRFCGCRKSEHRFGSRSRALWSPILTCMHVILCFFFGWNFIPPFFFVILSSFHWLLSFQFNLVLRFFFLRIAWKWCILQSSTCTVPLSIWYRSQ